VTASDAAELFLATQRAFAHACRRTGVREHDLAIGGATVQLRFAGDALEPFVLPPLAHFATSSPSGEPDLTVAVFDTRSTGVDAPRFPWRPEELGIQGEVATSAGPIRAASSDACDVVDVYDAASRVGIHWVADPATVPWWEWSAPLRTIVHWWTVPTARVPLHAGAVGRDGRGVLVAGASGAGKSTTALACLEAGLDYVGDDFVLVDVDALTVHPLTNTAKLARPDLPRFPGLADAVTNADRLDQEKAFVSVRDARPERLASALALSAIVVPEQTGTRGSRLVRASPAAALRVLAPTTCVHLPGAHREVVTKLGRLVRQVPCHRLEAGTDLGRLAGAVASALGGRSG
jgi:hypothetical protein